MAKIMEKLKGKKVQPKRVSKEEWLDRAADHLLDHGIGTFSMRSFAATRGVTTQALISHFGTRENLVREALKRTFHRDRLVAENLLRDMQSVPQFLEDFVAELQKPAFFHRSAIQLELIVLTAIEPDKHSDFAKRITRRVHEIFEAQIRKEGIPEKDVQRVSAFVVATARGLVVDAMGGRSRKELMPVVRQLIEWYRAQFPGRAK